MTSNAIFYVITAVLYLLAAVGVYKSESQAGRSLMGWIRPAVAIGLCLQGYLIYEAFFVHGTPRFGLALALSITLFACILILFVETFFSKIGNLLIFILPIGAVTALLPILMPGTPLGPETASFPFRMHLLLAILSYSLMTLALVQSLLLVALQNWLRNGGISKSQDGESGLLENMPSVLDMEKALFRLIWAGFIALTAAIVFGMIYTQGIYGSALRFDHKTVTTCLAWIIFGVLLWGHHFRGWRGRLAARWVVIGFCMLMVAYIGVRLVIEVGA